LTQSLLSLWSYVENQGWQVCACILLIK